MIDTEDNVASVLQIYVKLVDILVLRHSNDTYDCIRGDKAIDSNSLR
jgi:hypothetical protein